MKPDECNGKRCFTKRDAETVRNRRFKPGGGKRSNRRHNAPDNLRIYHCPLCNCWYLTSKPYED